MAPKQYTTMEETVKALGKRVNRIILFLVLSYIVSFAIAVNEWLVANENQQQFDRIKLNQELIRTTQQQVADSLTVTNRLLRE